MLQPAIDNAHRYSYWLHREVKLILSNVALFIKEKPKCIFKRFYSSLGIYEQPIKRCTIWYED